MPIGIVSFGKMVHFLGNVIGVPSEPSVVKQTNRAALTSAITCTPKSTSGQDDTLLKLLVNGLPNQGKNQEPRPRWFSDPIHGVSQKQMLHISLLLHASMQYA